MIEELKLPPKSIEAEQALISAMLCQPEVVNQVDWLRSDEFYRRDHQIMFETMQDMAALGKPVDTVTVISAMGDKGLLDEVDQEYVVELAVNSRGGHNALHYAMTIRDRAMSRKLIMIGGRISEIGYGQQELPDKIDSAQELVMEMNASKASEPVSITQVLRKTIADIDKRFNNPGSMVGLSTGFADLDAMTSGLQAGQMVVVAGRPAMGKTTFAMNIVEHNMINGKFCLVFNLEMTSENLMMKSLSSLGSIPYKLLRSGDIGDHTTELTAAAAKTKEKDVFIDDNASLTSQQILSRAKKVSQKAGKKIDLIVVDYLQLLNDKGDGHERITRISRALKLVAKSLGCPVIALSQLNRSLEQRPEKRPVMSDLRESGAIEQDADLIIMLYRDEVYNDNTNSRGIAEAIIRKNREGECGTVYMASQLHYCRFTNLASDYRPPAEIDNKQTKSGDIFDKYKR